jgi:hypothetical protein
VAQYRRREQDAAHCACGRGDVRACDVVDPSLLRLHFDFGLEFDFVLG